MNDERVRASIAAYVAAWNERDPAARARLVEAACAEDFRIVTSGRVLHGRAGLEALVAEFQARMPGARACLASAVEIHAHSFRYLGVVELDGRAAGETLDTGEHDGEGHLRLVLTFAGAQPAAAR